MSSKEEVGESRAHVVYNGSAYRINEIGLQLYPVSEYDFGEGLPYAPIDWPNADMKERTTSSRTELQSLLSDSFIRAITSMACNKICSSLTVENPFSAMLCDICCSEPIFCRDCCCILCYKTISLDYDGYSYIRCEATIKGYICGHVSHLDCALRAYMAGTVGGNINLDAQYLCRYCDSTLDLVPHALKLLNNCTSVVSRADIEIFLNVGICILCSSQKRSGKELLHRIESIKAKV
uniref:CDPK adapter protein 1 n=1 Tax=Solanum tuberosum TaxID=4113 RepID=M1DPQ7_SOLTU